MHKTKSSKRTKISIVLVLSMTLIGFLARQKMDSDYTQGQTREEWLAEYQKEDNYYLEMAAQIMDPAFDFTSLELIEIGEGPRYFSKWGHIFLRFVGSRENLKSDLTVSFLVDANDYEVDNWKGFFGGKYAIYPLIKPMRVHIHDYIETEKRTMTRYPVSINEEQKQKLKDILRAWIKDRSLMGTWAFYDNNCTNLLNRYLFEAGLFVHPLTESNITPVELLEHFRREGIVDQSVSY